jgi:hypothetical protein
LEEYLLARLFRASFSKKLLPLLELLGLLPVGCYSCRIFFVVELLGLCSFEYFIKLPPHFVFLADLQND